MPVEQIKEIGTNPKYRENPELIDEFLEEKNYHRFTVPSIMPNADTEDAAIQTARASAT